MKTFDPGKIGELIRQRRQEAGLTQNGLAELSSISRPTIGAYEESRGCPSIFNLLKIMGALGYESMDAFLGDLKPASGKLDQILVSYTQASEEKRRIVDFVLKN